MLESSPVALSAIALAGTMAAAVTWVAKYALKELSRDLKEHTKAAQELTQASKEQKKASSEVLAFMKNLNGKLTGATIQTIKEQHIGTQVLTETQVVGDRRQSAGRRGKETK